MEIIFRHSMKKLLLLLISFLLFNCKENIDPDKYIYPVAFQSSRNVDGIQLRWYSALALYGSNRIWLPGGEQGETLQIYHSEDDTLNFKEIYRTSVGSDEVYNFQVSETGSHHFFKIKVSAKNINPFFSRPIQVQFAENPDFNPIIEYPNYNSILLGNINPDGSAFIYSRYLEFLLDGSPIEDYAALSIDLSNKTEDLLIPEAEYPVWSPTGDMIAFHRTSGNDQNSLDSNIELYSIDTDSSIALTSGPNYFEMPVWFPDGRSILFLSRHTEDYSLSYMYRFDFEIMDYMPIFKGKDFAISNFRPSISPDGNMIAYMDYGEYYRYHIFLLDQSNGNISPMIEPEPIFWEDRFPCFSPDGKYLAFLTDRSGLYEIWLKELSSNRYYQITGDETIYIESQIVWGPESDKIFFTAGKDGAYGIYSIDINL